MNTAQYPMGSGCTCRRGWSRATTHSNSEETSVDAFGEPFSVNVTYELTVV